VTDNKFGKYKVLTFIYIDGKLQLPIYPLKLPNKIGKVKVKILQINKL